MDFAATTIAIRGKSSELIHAEYGVRPTGESQGRPAAPVLGATLSDGWYLLFINDRTFVPPHILEQLSRGAQVVWCSVNELETFSFSGAWHEGKEVWSITHDGRAGADQLDSTGDLPREYPGIEQRLKDQQQPEGEINSMFYVPIEVAWALTGFRYHGDDEGRYPVESFLVLERIKPPRRWWEFWRS